MSKRGRRAAPSQELHFGGEVGSMDEVRKRQSIGRAAFENAMELAKRKKAQDIAMNSFTNQMQKRREETARIDNMFNKSRMATMPAEWTKTGKLYSSYEEAMKMARRQRKQPTIPQLGRRKRRTLRKLLG